MAKLQPDKNDSQNDSNYSIGYSHVSRHFFSSKAWLFLWPCTKTNAFAGDLLQVKNSSDIPGKHLERKYPSKSCSVSGLPSGTGKGGVRVVS
jgi:hypothetical protein